MTLRDMINPNRSILPLPLHKKAVVRLQKYNIVRLGLFRYFNFDCVIYRILSQSNNFGYLHPFLCGEVDFTLVLLVQIFNLLNKTSLLCIFIFQIKAEKLNPKCAMNLFSQIKQVNYIIRAQSCDLRVAKCDQIYPLAATSKNVIATWRSTILGD